MNLFVTQRGREFSLPELVLTADSILSKLVRESVDGRVSAQPDARTIRFYQTSGLLAKPTRYEGRNAVYGFRHLLQIVCIKKLQAEGYSLSVIQRSLTGRSDGELEEKISSLLPIEVGNADSAVETSPAPRGNAVQRRLISLDVGPGVTLTIDRDRFSEPEKKLSDLASVVADFLEKTL